MIEIFSCGKAFFTSFAAVWVWLYAHRYCIHHIIDVLLASSQSILSRNLSICDYAWNWCKKQVVARIDHISNFAYRLFLLGSFQKLRLLSHLMRKLVQSQFAANENDARKNILKGKCNKSWELKQWASLWINKNTHSSGLWNSNKNKLEHGMKWAHMQMRRHGNVADEKEKPSHITHYTWCVWINEDDATATATIAILRTPQIVTNEMDADTRM